MRVINVSVKVLVAIDAASNEPQLEAAKKLASLHLEHEFGGKWRFADMSWERMSNAVLLEFERESQ
jgi:hypothetical protein